MMLRPAKINVDLGLRRVKSPLAASLHCKVIRLAVGCKFDALEDVSRFIVTRTRHLYLNTTLPALRVIIINHP